MSIDAYIFSQDQPPTNYVEAEYGPWEPLEVMLVRKVLSRNKSGN